MRYCRLFGLKLLICAQNQGPNFGRNGGAAALKSSYMPIPTHSIPYHLVCTPRAPTELIRWGEAVRLEPLGPDSGVLSWGGNQAFSTGSALGRAISRRTTSPNGPHIPHPHCSGRALQLLSYKQPPKPARTASKPGRPEAVFRGSRGGTCRRIWAGLRPFLREF